MGSAPRYSQHGSVRVGIVSEDRTLLVYEPSKHDPKWKIPGGGMEDGESVIDAAIREAAEETGIWILPEEIEQLEEARQTEGGVYVPHFCLARVPRESFDQYNPCGHENDMPLKVRDFAIADIESLPDFLDPHRRFLPYLSGIPA